MTEALGAPWHLVKLYRNGIVAGREFAHFQPTWCLCQIRTGETGKGQLGIIRFERPSVVVDVATVLNGENSGRLSRSLMHKERRWRPNRIATREQILAFAPVLYAPLSAR